MFTKKEIFAILAATLSISTIVSLSVESMDKWQMFFLTSLLVVFFVIMINVLAKKAIAGLFEARLEVSLWEFSRFLFFNPINKTIKNYKPHQYMKSKFPAGFFMPLIIKFLSAGLLNWMGSLVFDVKGTIYRATKRWASFQYSEITEEEMAWIAFIGIIANLVFATLGYLINMPLFSKINLTYAFYNALPIGNLDGMKMFFGKQELFWTSAVLVSIGVVFSMVMI